MSSVRKRVAILISGRGSNMASLISAAAETGYPAEIVGVVSDQPDAPGLSFAASKGVTVFYLSNRASDLGTATLENLRKLDFPIAADEQVFLGLGTIVPGCEQNGSEKGCRRELISRKYRVLMQVGDQLGDFVDVLANTQQGREQAVAPYLDWIGQRWFVLPNPTYGSWEPALFDNDWSQSAPARRRAKQAALRTQ